MYEREREREKGRKKESWLAAGWLLAGLKG